ncbi:TraR/DksA C4-type zinc finger protein [Heyndrickxia sp. NPDC080065]|uniref:TraR/DksA C4-type zinc finger protein n=1 Tax=Heyndrickxia sp. NPDC080065 TaxID=3390568 RepID=UPI003CFC7A03
MLTDKQLAELRSRLLQEKSEFENQLQQNDHYGLESGFWHESMGELSSYDNHPADDGTELFEREKDVALNEHSEYELTNIDKALQAMKDGSYGKCIECGKEIPLERLEAIPSTLYCKEHSPDRRVSHRRPAEERVLLSSLGNLDFDDTRREHVEFDAEDSWQAVAQWGSSDSPSDFFNPPEHYNDMYIDSHENIGYVEDFENFVGNDMYGKNKQYYPNPQYDEYTDGLDEEGIMTTFGDLPAYEHDPYVEDDE